MGQGLLTNMRVYMGPSLPERGVFLQLSGAGFMEWQSLVSKMYDSGWSRCINTGHGDNGFGEDGGFWAGK